MQELVIVWENKVVSEHNPSDGCCETAGIATVSIREQRIKDIGWKDGDPQKEFDYWAEKAADHCDESHSVYPMVAYLIGDAADFRNDKFIYIAKKM